MTSCTIIISHHESLPFLHACIRQIRKYKHPEIEQKILIAEQSGVETRQMVLDEYAKDVDIGVCTMAALYSGYGIDVIMQDIGVDTEYVCQLHSDSFPVHKNWLSLPITLIEENKFSFVGQLQFIADGTASIYPPHRFFAMAQCFNVAKTQTYRELSYEAGFTRFHNRPQSGLTFLNDDWAQWAKDDYENKGSDDDVVAFHWNGKYKTEDMLGLAVTGYISPAYGRIIEDVLFHFGSCRESVGVNMGDEYNEFTRRINEDYSDVLISEMVDMAKANKPPEMEILSRNYWDGALKQSFPANENIIKRIDELKNM